MLPVDKHWMSSGSARYPQVIPLIGKNTNKIPVVIRDTRVRVAKLLHSAGCVQDRRVVSTPKSLANLGEAVLCQFFRQGHRYLSGAGHRAIPFAGQKFRCANLKIFRDRLLNVLQRNLFVLSRQYVSKRVLRKLEADFPPRELGIRDQPAQRTL